MAAVIIDYLRQYLSLSWLTGPVFDKELRVSSRKRRNYVLRFAYISLLLTILFFIWIQVVNYRSTNVVQISRMAQAGKYIVACIVVFQFCAAQIIAVVMLSNSISDEIYHKTLGMLMTTPITSLQIVMGKLLSKLLQLLLLLAISMPLLAIVRMFGGVPWQFITSSLYITLTTVIFVSSLSLFYSIFYRRAYSVIIVTILTLFGLFAVIPFIIVTIVQLTEAYKTIPEQTLIFILYQPNPYLTFLFNTVTMIQPQAGMGSFYISAYINSALFLVLSLLLLLISIIMVRKVALRQATGQLLLSRKRKYLEKEKEISTNNKNSAIVSVIGPPILWKELILPFRRSRKIYRIIGVCVFLSLLFYTYWFFMKENAIDDGDIHGVYAMIFMGLGALFTIVISSVSITSEKESHSWPLLLTSTLSDSQIVIGKLYGILSRCLPVWLLLLGHVLFFSKAGLIHPVAIPLTIILEVWFVFFICSSGMYFSSLFKHTTTAVIMNFVFAAFIWGIIPLILGIIGEIVHDHDYVEVFVSINPFVQGIVIMLGTVDLEIHQGFGKLVFNWPMGNRSYQTTLLIFLISFCIYMTLALIFLWRTRNRLRREVF